MTLAKDGLNIYTHIHTHTHTHTFVYFLSACVFLSLVCVCVCVHPSHGCVSCVSVCCGFVYWEMHWITLNVIRMYLELRTTSLQISLKNSWLSSYSIWKAGRCCIGINSARVCSMSWRHQLWTSRSHGAQCKFVLLSAHLSWTGRRLHWRMSFPLNIGLLRSS